MDGIFNIYKEKGFTSHDVVAIVRKTINQKKVGHTGTLDPDAEGVLPVCVGKATKLADYIMAERKTYSAGIKLGVTTATQDAAGDVIEERPADVSRDEFERALSGFVGDISQIPPMYSALKIGGQKLCNLARKGIEIERKPRNITIFDIRIVEFNPPDLAIIEVVCSKGTYIRTLCADIGEALGCGAHMSSLLRLESGAFGLGSSIRLSGLKALAEAGRAEEALLSMDSALSGYKRAVAARNADKYLFNGCRIYEGHFDAPGGAGIGESLAVYSAGGMLAGLYTVMQDEEKNRLFLKPLRMLI